MRLFVNPIKYFRWRKARRMLDNYNQGVNPEAHTIKREYENKMEEIKKQSHQLHKEITKARETSKTLNRLLSVTAITFQAQGGKLHERK